MSERIQAREGEACGRSGKSGRGDAFEGKTQCPDCFQCQGCSEDRCRVCRKQAHSGASTLATGFTYGEYLAWKEEREKGRAGSRSSI